jgi:hypothetical protein
VGGGQWGERGCCCRLPSDVTTRRGSASSRVRAS